jgi:hypothetical protein
MSEMKLAMIGLDTSHCEAFTGLLNNEAAPFHIPGARVTRAYPGGSQAFSLSRDRVAGYTDLLRDRFGVTMCGSPEEAAQGVDAILLESVDGRQHLEQFRVLAECGVPVFIDKPLACSYAEAAEIAAIAARKNIPVMTCSAIRMATGIAGLVDASTPVNSAEAFGPISLLPDYPSYYWYGVHSVDVLFSYMGRGCREVRVVHTDSADLLVGSWADGRIGTVRGGQFPNLSFGCTLWTAGGVISGQLSSEAPTYAPMLAAVVEFFRTGQSPIDLAESVEIISFLDAAERSLQQGSEGVDAISLERVDVPAT